MVDTSATVVDEPSLRGFTVRCLEAAGAPREDAEITADNMIQANLRGEDSHGVQLLPIWVRRMKAGGIKLGAPLDVVQDGPATALLDAHHGIGQVAAVRAMELAVQKAAKTGFAIVGVRHVNSYTNAKHSTMLPLRHRMIGFSISNAGAIVFPPGGLTFKMGTNPICIAVPAREEFPVVLDMSTAAVGMERVREHLRRGAKLPPNWAVDKNGRPTDDPAAVWDGGSMANFGGYKGYGLAVMIDLLTGVLMGAGFIDQVQEWEPYDGHEDRGKLFGAINIEHFMPYDQMVERVDTLVRQVRDCRLAPGVERIFLPGEQGFLRAQQRSKDGIPLDPAMVAQLRELVQELHVPGLPGTI